MRKHSDRLALLAGAKNENDIARAGFGHLAVVLRAISLLSICDATVTAELAKMGATMAQEFQNEAAVAAEAYERLIEAETRRAS